MTETPTEAREPDLPNNRASATAPMPKRKSAASVARAQRVIDFEARLARRGPSPATACSAHGAERGASLAARSRAVNRNVLTLQAISTYDHWMPPTRPTPHPSLRSMTGFGRAEAVGDGVAITVEARSVNHRHLDIAFRLPRALSAFEMDARRLIQARVERGRIDVSVQLGPPPGQSTQQIRVDTAIAAQYIDQARALGRATGLGDEGRILTEVAIWAEKTDVREELTRLTAHLEQLALLLDKGGSVGRPLDFLIQELNREVNTIASKADDLELSQSALAAKGIIEKMREQAQNLE